MNKRSLRRLASTLILLAVLALSGATTATAWAADEEAGFKSMFNGRDLAGWEGKPGWW